MPTHEERFAALAATFYARHPETLEYRRDVSLMHSQGVVMAFPALSIAAVLGELLSASYRVLCDYDSDRRTIVKRRRDDPATADQVTREDLREVVAFVLQRLPDPGPNAPHSVRAAVRDVRTLAEPQRNSPYVRAVAERVIDELERFPGWNPAPKVVSSRSSLAPAERAIRRRASREASDVKHNDERRESRRDEAQEAEQRHAPAAVMWALEWREQVEPGTYPAKDVHAAYVQAEPDGLGRNKFYRYAEHPDVLGPRTRAPGRAGRKQGDVFTPKEAENMTREQRKQLAELVVRQLADDIRADLDAGLVTLREDADGRLTVTPAESVPRGSRVRHLHAV